VFLDDAEFDPLQLLRVNAVANVTTIMHRLLNLKAITYPPKNRFSWFFLFYFKRF